MTAHLQGHYIIPEGPVILESSHVRPAAASSSLEGEKTEVNRDSVSTRTNGTCYEYIWCR